MEHLFEHPHIEAHFAGRESDALAIDAVLADLYEIGEVGMDVHSDDGQILYTCSLVLRSAEGSVVVTAESALAAALGCLLEVLLSIDELASRGIVALEDFLDGDGDGDGEGHSGAAPGR
jgi:hypothetical protein